MTFRIYTLLRYSVLGYNADTVAASLENVVYLELRRRGYQVYIGEMGISEIDFVATRQNEKLYVLRTDEFAGGNYEGIKTMHVADFLLSKEGNLWEGFLCWHP